MRKRFIIAAITTVIILVLSHHMWLGHKHHEHFDVMLFIIISYLVYLFSLKLTSYLADFKNIKQQSRVEIVFLCIFFAMLLIPTSNINQDKVSKAENRNLATWKALINKKGELNYTFGKDFEKWFNDRFAGRLELTNLHIKYMYYINKIANNNKGSLVKSSNFAFFRWHLPNENVLPEKNIKSVAESLTKLDSYYKSQGIDLYVLIVPYNAYIYTQNTGYYNKQSKKYIKKINNNINELKTASTAKITYPYNELLEGSKTEYTYFKTDHHWTDYGAFIGYRELFKHITQNHTNIKPLNENNFTITYSKQIRSDFNREFFEGWVLRRAFPGLTSREQAKILGQDYKYYTYIHDSDIHSEILNTEFYKGKASYNKNGQDYKVMMLGTSMNENLYPFIISTFKNVKYIRFNTEKLKEKDQFKIMKYYNKDILKYKPDIIIITLAPLNFINFNQFFAED